MQLSEFFMPYLYITCGENYGSHSGTLNIDYQGRNESGRLYHAPIYAPFDCKCVYAENSWASGNMRIVESLNEVQTPIGNMKVTMMWGHDENPILSKGDIIKKGQIMGATGNYGYSTGDHVHVACARGPWAGFDNTGAHQQLNNAEHQYNLFYVDNVVIEDGGDYPWKKSGEPVPPTPTDFPFMGTVLKGSPLYNVNGYQYPNGASANRQVEVQDEVNGRYKVWGATFNPHVVYVDKCNVIRDGQLYPFTGIVAKGSPLYNANGYQYPNGASADRYVEVQGELNGRYQVWGQTFNPHVVYVDKQNVRRV